MKRSASLTHIIRSHRGTIDKYMGDRVWRFGGASSMPDHAQLAVTAALEMSQAIGQINANHRQRGLPEIGVGIGLNTGVMCVGDMGSDIRRCQARSSGMRSIWARAWRGCPSTTAHPSW